MAEQLQETSDKNVEIWKIKKLIKSLEAARGYEENFIQLI
jgi:peptide chain release factor subunit 1